MNSQDRATLKRLFAKPPPTDIPWSHIESTLRALGVEVRERPGSRVALIKNNEIMLIALPHPKPLAVGATVADIAAYLKAVGAGRS